MRVRTTVVLAMLVGFGALAATPSPAGADAISPPGSCRSSGFWVQGRFGDRSVALDSSDVIVIPLADRVRWQGRVGDAQLGEKVERRPINGVVEIELPFGQAKTINDWGGTSRKAANKGRYKYNFPSVFKGVKMKVSGYHDESGKRICSGSVYVKVEGSPLSNPLTWAGIVGAALSVVALVWAGRRKHRIIGTLAGLVLGGAVGGLLLMFAVIPLDSPVLAIAPLVGLVLGGVWAFTTPLARKT
jgi:hypothetical protein